MTEEEAREWLRAHFGVPRETILARYAAILQAEAPNQNLVAASTLGSLWFRHLVDSAQLIPLVADAGEGVWLDVGSGAGLPGLVAAILTDRIVVLVEPRAKRAAFLCNVVAQLELDSRVTVQASRVETYRPRPTAAVVSARAVAALPQLLASTEHCTNSSTVWVLPKGRTAHSEVADARAKWQGVFHVEPSITQPDSGVVIARGVRPR